MLRPLVLRSGNDVEVVGDGLPPFPFAPRHPAAENQRSIPLFFPAPSPPTLRGAPPS